MTTVSVVISLEDISSFDLMDEMEDRGYLVIGSDEIRTINEALKLGDKRKIVEALDEFFLVTIDPSFEEVFFPDEE